MRLPARARSLIILYAFSAEDKSYVFPPPGLTAQWFGVALDRPDVWAAMRLSFEVAAWSHRHRARARRAGRRRPGAHEVLRPRRDLAAADPAIALPGVVTGIALRSAYHTLEIPFSFWTIVIATRPSASSVVFNNAVARLRRLNPHLIEASMDLGADGWQTAAPRDPAPARLGAARRRPARLRAELRRGDRDHLHRRPADHAAI
jgi:putative spermidine/putrescine transport system permease protein